MLTLVRKARKMCWLFIGSQADSCW